MKWLLKSALLMLPMMLMLGGCSGSSNPVDLTYLDFGRETVYLPAEYCGEATIVPLLAGQTIPVGNVIVTNDENFIYIEFVTIDPWVLTETHVAVSDTLEGIPQTKKGSPKVGQFAYDIDSFIDLNNWPDATELYIAAHAVVERIENGVPVQEETAWGEGEHFNKSWAMYFLYTVQDCDEPGGEDWLELPDEPVEMIVNPGYWAWFDTELLNVPCCYTVEDWWYEGWCVQEDIPMELGITQWTYLYSSLASDLPPEVSGYDWDIINYLINHADLDAGAADVQEALWWFTENKTEYPTDPEVLAMVLAAEEFGPGYWPEPYGTVVVICYVAGTQLSIITVDNS